MSLNKPKSFFPVEGGSIAPQSVAAAGTAASGWIDCAEAHTIAMLLMTGLLDVGRVEVTWEQAKTNAGGDAKALDTGGFAQHNTALNADNTETWIEGNVEELDINNGFRFVKATITGGATLGGAGALIAAALFACKN